MRSSLYKLGKLHDLMISLSLCSQLLLVIDLELKEHLEFSLINDKFINFPYLLHSRFNHLWFCGRMT
jgi:hypothetical protein